MSSLSTPGPIFVKFKQSRTRVGVELNHLELVGGGLEQSLICVCVCRTCTISNPMVFNLNNLEGIPKRISALRLLNLSNLGPTCFKLDASHASSRCLHNMQINTMRLDHSRGMRVRKASRRHEQSRAVF